MEDIRDQVNIERIEFERRCRTKDENKLRWYETALCSLLKNEMDDSERFLARQGNMDYLNAGIELVEKIFFENHINYKKFWEDVTNIMECTYNKMNSLYLVGTSNAGKSTIATAITKWAHRCMIGQSGNASQFIFQDAPNKTLILMEEALFTPGTVDDFKNMCEGSTNICVNVKNRKNKRMTHRTPMITTSNMKPWQQYCSSHDVTFINRGYHYEFNKAITKEDIALICNKYPKVLKSHGEIHLSMVHMLATYKKHFENNWDPHRYMAEIAALANHDWTCTGMN